MARALEAAVRPQIETRLLPAAAALAALAIVHGDIGTSALYGFKQAAEAGGRVLPRRHDGHSLPVILWSLLLIVAFKYRP